MADQSTAFLQQPQFLDPEQQQQLNEIARKQRMAQLLTQTGMTPVQGQVVGNRFVAPAWSQYANQLFSAYSGRKTAEEAEAMQSKLAQALKGQEQSEIAKYTELSSTDPAAALKFALQANSPVLKGIAQDALKTREVAPGASIVRGGFGPAGIETVFKAPEKPVVVGNSLVDPITGKPIYTAPKDFAGHIYESENGPVLIDTRTGKGSPVTMNGQVITGGKPLTESQGQAVGFGSRAKVSDKIMTAIENQGTKTGGVWRAAGASVPLIGGALQRGLNWTASDQQLALDQARKDFVTAVLRKESGASISPSEFENEEKKYFPQPGESEYIVKQKQKARERAIKSLEEQAGPGARKIREYNPSLEEVAPAAVEKKNQGWRLKNG